MVYVSDCRFELNCESAHIQNEHSLLSIVSTGCAWHVVVWTLLWVGAMRMHTAGHSHVWALSNVRQRIVGVISHAVAVCCMGSAGTHLIF